MLLCVALSLLWVHSAHTGDHILVCTALLVHFEGVGGGGGGGIFTGLGGSTFYHSPHLFPHV